MLYIIYSSDRKPISDEELRSMINDANNLNNAMILKVTEEPDELPEPNEY